MLWEIQGGRPHSNPPLVTASPKGRVGVQAGLVDEVVEDVVVDDEVVDVEVEVVGVGVDDVVEVVEVVVLEVVVEVVIEVNGGLQEQAEL